MPWTKLDDSIIDNAKLLNVLPASRWLYIAAICFCRRNHTAGLLTPTQMAALVASQSVTKRHVDQLLAVGCLVQIDYGFEVHAYEEFNPLTSTERVRKHRRGKAPETEPPVSVTRSTPVTETPLARAPRAGLPVPVPQPVVTTTSNVSLNTPEALAICQAHEELGAIALPRDLLDAEGLVAEFRAPRSDQFVAAMRVTVDYRRDHQLRPIVRVVGFRETFKRLHAQLIDADQRPRADVSPYAVTAAQAMP